jgi:hypothetical protein
MAAMVAYHAVSPQRNPLFILFADCANFTTNISPRNGNLNLLVQIKFLNLLAHRAKGNVSFCRP